jgi:hypothetical protein
LSNFSLSMWLARNGIYEPARIQPSHPFGG